MGESSMPRSTITEEYDENEPLNVEAEQELDEPLTEPWNPNDVRVGSKSFSLRNILDMIAEGSLDLAPDFQRRQVWKLPQKSRLIESILLQIPLPAFYFAEERDGMMRVVDGLQRLSTIDQFCRGDGENLSSFRLQGLEYLEEVEGKRFEDLAPNWRRRLHNSQIYVHVIDPATPDAVKFDIFKRINTGGSPLNAQEIRHCMSGQTARNFLKDSVGLPSFQQATSGVLREHKRMVDREVALRFYAFFMPKALDEFRNYRTMDAFLTEATRKIDREIGEGSRRQLLGAFDQAMRNAYQLFGDHAFRKWPLGEDRRNPINRALFECWSVMLARYAWTLLQPRRRRIVQGARELMTNDFEYDTAISVSTGSPNRVLLRFERTREAVQAALR